MRTLVSLGVVVFLVVGLAPGAHSQPATAPPAAKPDKPAKATRNISGTVRSAGAEMVVVAGRDRGRDAEWTFAIEPTTNIRKGNKSIVAADLKPGDAVQVRYLERDGKARAEAILVKGPRK